MIDVFLSGISAVLDFADTGAGGELHALHIALDQAFDFVFQFIGKLITVAVKEFNAVKLHRIVGSGNHNAGIHFVFSCQIRNGRGGNHSYINAVGSHGACSRHQGICQHIAGNSGVTAYHDRRLMRLLLCQHTGSRLS